MCTIAKERLVAYKSYLCRKGIFLLESILTKDSTETFNFLRDTVGEEVLNKLVEYYAERENIIC